MSFRPVLLVDIDGVLSLWGFDQAARPPGVYAAVEGVPHFLSEQAARHLQTLQVQFELVWCSGWEERANEHLPGLVGLGPFPHVELDRHAAAGTTTPGHWKLGAIDAHVGAQPLAWVDDAFNDACHAWAAAREAPTLLVETEPATGLTAAHAQRLRAWAAELSAD